MSDSILKRFDAIVASTSLQTFDSPLAKAFNESFIGSLISAPFKSISAALQKAGGEQFAKIGTLLQQGAFVAVAVMIFSLWLPMFASDKEILAIVSMLALAMYVVGALLGGKDKRQFTSVDAIVLLFLCINVVAACASHYFMPSLKGLAKLVIYTSSYFLFSAVATTPKRRLLLMIAAVGGGFVAAAYGLYQYKVGVEPLATWEDPTVETKTTRIYSTLGNPNLLAGYLIPFVPLSISMLIAAIAEKKWLYAVISAPVAGAILLATVLTASRGGYIGIVVALGALFVMLAAWCWPNYPRLRPVILFLSVILPLAIIAIVFVVPSVHQRVFSMLQGREHSSNKFRMNVWLASLEMFKDNWWIGIGTGNQAFRLAYGLYMKSGFDALGTYCVPLEIAVEAGIFALIVFAIFVMAVLGRAHIAFWSKNCTWEKWICAGMAAAVIGIIAQGFVDTVFYRPQIHFVFWLLSAALVTAGLTYRKPIEG